ncbi:hypothetical protein ACWKWC_15225, partial [Geodermatophilus nigrescens]
MLPVTTVPRPRTDLGGWLLPAARRWHAAEDTAAAVRAVLTDLATVLPASASASVTLLGTGRRPGAPAGARPAPAPDPAPAPPPGGPPPAPRAG